MRNAGVVNEHAAQLDDTRFTKYLGGNIALVAQGGGQKGIFTAGVLDAFLLSNFDPFDAFYGTSAGAMNLAAYLCRQPGLGKAFLLELTTRREFFHLYSYIRKRHPLGLDWAMEKICHYPYKLDLDMGESVLGGREAVATVTETVHLQDRYLPIFGPDWKKVLTATCAIPRLYDRAVEIGGQTYHDGGISASVPAQEAWRREARLIVVIRTENLDQPLPEGVAPGTEAHVQPGWFQNSLATIQSQWDKQIAGWKQDWSGFLKEQFDKSYPEHPHQHAIKALNGGRWLFGADDVYRLSHILGERFDSGLADMLMIHYQTYTLTQEFLHNPPDDCFVVQIAPDAQMKSSPLLSKEEQLLSDYELGFKAGENFIQAFKNAGAGHLSRSV